MKDSGGRSEMLSVSRREVKYLISLKDRLLLLDALDRLLTPDEYGGYSGYTVRSIYFDSIANDDYIDKRLGEPVKKRIRMRIYHPDDEKVKFEVKRKDHGRELKESMIISREDAQLIIGGDHSALLGYDSPMASYAYDLMTTRIYRPVSIIEYDRRAYTHRDFSTRVTLDSGLRYCTFCRDFFSPRLNFRSGMAKDMTILEIKYDRFLFRQIQEVLEKCDLSKRPPGKFATSRKLLKEYYY